MGSERPRAPRQAARRASERVHRDRCRAVRHRAPAARRARLLRQVPGPPAVRKGLIPAGGIPVLLASARDTRRVLRLLPGLSRLLEAVRHRPPGYGAAEGVLPECAQDHAATSEGGVAYVTNSGVRGVNASRNVWPSALS